MYVNQFFRARSTVKCFTFFSDQSVFAIFLESLFTLDVLFSTLAQHISMKLHIQRLSLLRKDLRKEWTNSLNSFFSHAFKKHDSRPIFTFFSSNGASSLVRFLYRDLQIWYKAPPLMFSCTEISRPAVLQNIF